MDYIKTYKLTATEYIAKHNPTEIGGNAFGTYYEHPLYGDESPLLVVPNWENKIHVSHDRDIPSEEEMGATFARA